MGCAGSTANTATTDKKEAGNNADSAAPQADEKSRGLPKKDIKADWEELSKKLPRTRSEEDNTARDALFDSFDPNGNKILSLAEVDKGCREIGLDRLTDDLAPILIRAFNAAKSAATRHGNKNDREDFVERNEFRLLMVYIYNYFEMWIAFDDIDTGDDRRISLTEFKLALPKLAEWGVVVTDADETFKTIDKNGGGSVLFQEFAEWAFNEGVDVDNKANVE